MILADAYKFLESQNLALERDYEDLKAMRQRKEEELQQFREEAQIKKQIQNEVFIYTFCHPHNLIWPCIFIFSYRSPLFLSTNDCWFRNNLSDIRQKCLKEIISVL